MKKKVTGIGGVFFQCKNPAEMKAWYSKNLGMITDEYGALFESRSSDNPEKKTYLQWSAMKENDPHFSPSEKPFMINYRVENIEELVEEFKREGITILDEITTYDYGKFVHIMDPEGNKIELWESIDTVFTDYSKGNVNK